MSTTTLLCLAVVLIGWGINVFWRQRGQQAARARLSESLRACQLLLGLVSQLQQHRGMSAAWLAGDVSFAAKRQDKADEIHAQLAALMPVARAESGTAHPCFTGHDCAIFRFNWRALLEDLAGLKPELSLARHSALISQILAWLQALGEARLMPLAGDATQRQLVRNATDSLPALAECLGQARALGASVAAQGVCSPVARVRLLFLVNRAEGLLQQANVDGSGGATCAPVEKMTRTIRNDLLASRVEIGAKAYFSLATSAVDSVFDWAGRSSQQLSVSLGLSGSAPRQAGAYWSQV